MLECLKRTKRSNGAKYRTSRETFIFPFEESIMPSGSVPQTIHWSSRRGERTPGRLPRANVALPVQYKGVTCHPKKSIRVSHYKSYLNFPPMLWLSMLLTVCTFNCRLSAATAAKFPGWAARCLLGGWMLSSLVLMNSFTGLLKASLMVKSPTERIDSMEDLAQRPQITPLIFDGSPVVATIGVSATPVGIGILFFYLFLTE